MITARLSVSPCNLWQVAAKKVNRNRSHEELRQAIEVRCDAHRCVRHPACPRVAFDRYDYGLIRRPIRHVDAKRGCINFHVNERRLERQINRCFESAATSENVSKLSTRSMNQTLRHLRELERFSLRFVPSATEHLETFSLMMSLRRQSALQRSRGLRHSVCVASSRSPRISATTRLLQ